MHDYLLVLINNVLFANSEQINSYVSVSQLINYPLDFNEYVRVFNNHKSIIQYNNKAWWIK